MYIIPEQSKTGMELLKDNSLSLDFADLFEDDAFGHFLNDEEALLDDFDGLGVADEVGGCIDDLGKVRGGIEVVYAVEVVKVVKGGESTPVVEGGEAAGA